MKLKFIYITAFSFLVLTNCNGNKTTDITEDISKDENQIIISEAQFKRGAMVLGTMNETTFPEIVKVNGMIDVPPENRAIVSNSMGGYIKETPFLVGDIVNKGQVLVTLENPEFVELQQRYLEINEQLRYLKSEYERHKAMMAEKIISEKSFLKAESDYNTAVASHKGLEKQLQMLNMSISKIKEGNISSTVPIYSPISGSIVRVNVNKGSYVSPATEIMEIIDNHHIHLELSVFEKDIMKVKKGQEIVFRISEASEEEFKAEVYLVGRAIDNNRTIKVHAHLKNEDDNTFLAGMFVQAGIIINQSNVFALPDTAVVENNSSYQVLVLEKMEGGNYIFNAKNVVAGPSNGGFVAISNAEEFSPEAKFLVSGAFELISD